MKRNLSEKQIGTIRDVYQAFVDLFETYVDTEAFYEAVQKGDDITKFIVVRKCKFALQRARFDLKELQYRRLKELLDTVVETTYEELEGSDKIEELSEEFRKDIYLMGYFMESLIEETEEEYFEELCECLEEYVMGNY